MSSRKFKRLVSRLKIGQIFVAAASTGLFLFYVYLATSFLYDRYEAVQPPWPRTKPIPTVYNVSADELLEIYPNLHAKVVSSKSKHEREKKAQIGGENAEESKILCWISSKLGNRWKSEAARSTWGRGCDKFLIMLTADEVKEVVCPRAFPYAVDFGKYCCREADDFFHEYCLPKHKVACEGFTKNASLRCSNYKSVELKEYVYLDSPEGYENLWKRTVQSVDYIQLNEDISNFDFILKADDDTFVNIDSLKLALSKLQPDAPWYIGHALAHRDHIWMSGGAGYVLSRAAFRGLYRTMTERGLL